MILAIKISIIAFVYAELLTEPGQILNPLFRLLVNLPEYINKPLIGCSKCVSGQLACWTYLWYWHSCYNVLMHLFFICSSIIITWLLSNLKKKLDN